jgi:hypothetical protein
MDLLRVKHQPRVGVNIRPRLDPRTTAPLADDRLEERSDGRLALRLKTRWRDGTTHILMRRHELLERLVPLIPPPRAHQVRYHGVLAPCASARKRIVPGARAAVATPESVGPGANGPTLATSPERAGTRPVAPAAPGCAGDIAPSDPGPWTIANGSSAAAAAPPDLPPTPIDPWSVHHRIAPAANRPNLRRLAWAELLQRVFAVDALCCPRCGARMRLLAAIEDPEVACKILACLDLRARAPPLEPASGEADAFGHTPEPGCEFGSDDPAWAFDQTPPYDDMTA